MFDPSEHRVASPLDWLDDELDQLRAAQLGRSRRLRASAAGPEIRLDGQQVISFASNDYLGLASHPNLASAARQTAERFGWGAAASPLVAGHDEPTAALEAELAAWLDTEAALVFGSGYAANVSTITALVGRGDVVYSDETNHASIIDGCRLSRAQVVVYPHGNAAWLADRLEAPSGHRRRLIVTDSLFSMDGDVAPLESLASLAQASGSMLLVDEAHATGVCGARGTGLIEALGLEHLVDIRLGTLSKSLGGVGGFVAGRRSLVEWLVNRSRGYIFSTALPPACAGASRAALALVHAEPQRRTVLADRARRLRARLAKLGWLAIGNDAAWASQIIPLICGSAEAALAASRALLERGLYVPAIRPPSVAPGSSRLRVALSYLHDESMIERLLSALAEIDRPT